MIKKMMEMHSGEKLTLADIRAEYEGSIYRYRYDDSYVRAFVFSAVLETCRRGRFEDLKKATRGVRTAKYMQGFKVPNFSTGEPVPCEKQDMRNFLVKVIQESKAYKEFHKKEEKNGHVCRIRLSGRLTFDFTHAEDDILKDTIPRAVVRANNGCFDCTLLGSHEYLMLELNPSGLALSRLPQDVQDIIIKLRRLRDGNNNHINS